MEHLSSPSEDAAAAEHAWIEGGWLGRRLGLRHPWLRSAIVLLRQEQGSIAAYGLAMGVLSLVPVLFSRAVYDWIAPDRNADALWVYALGGVLATLWLASLHILRARLVERLARRIDEDLAGRIVRSMLGMGLKSKPARAGAFAATLREYEGIKDHLVTAQNLAVLADTALAPLYLAMAFAFGGPAALVSLLLAAAIAFGQWALYAPTAAASSRAAHAHAVRTGLAVEAALALESVKLLGAGPKIALEWDKASAANADATFKTRLFGVLGGALARYGLALSTILTLAATAAAMIDGKIVLGAVVATGLLAAQATSPLVQLPALLLRASRAKAGFEQIASILDAPQERPDGIPLPAALEGVLEWRGVGFSYPSSALRALDGADLKVFPGTTAILGANGSGKSTLARLLVGLYEPDSGLVLLDGIDVRAFDPAALRRAVAYLPQNPPLFKGTLRSNLLMGRPASEEEMRAACAATGASDIADAHPLGYDRPVQEGGADLSGGERQLVALTRTLLQGAQVVVLDEPTEGLDAKRAAKAAQAIEDNAKTAKTTILVSHSLELLSKAPRKILVERGRVLGEVSLADPQGGPHA